MSVTRKQQTILELVGYAAAVAGVTCLGQVLAGPVLAAAFGLIVLAAVLIFVGNL